MMINPGGKKPLEQAQFLAALYRAVIDAGEKGILPVRQEEWDDIENLSEHPVGHGAYSLWRWILSGYQDYWLLKVVDYRPPIFGRPYQLNPMDYFFTWSRESGIETPDEFLDFLVTKMVDQQLGQKQAANDPAWENEGEFFNPWGDRYPDRPKPPIRSVPVTEDEFLAALYDPLVTFVKAREAFDPLAFVDVEKLHPRHPRWSPGWHWVVAGDKNDWWLEVLDERPPWAHHPYRLDPKGDQAFFAGICGRHDLPSDVTEPGFLNYFFAELSELMGDERFGQEKALTAYRHGATTDNPPWVHTTNGI